MPKGIRGVFEEGYAFQVGRVTQHPKLGCTGALGPPVINTDVNNRGTKKSGG